MQYDIVETISGPYGSADVCQEFKSVRLPSPTRPKRGVLTQATFQTTPLGFFAQATGHGVVTPLSWGLGGPYLFQEVSKALALGQLLAGVDLVDRQRLVLAPVHLGEPFRCYWRVIGDVTIEDTGDGATQWSGILWPANRPGWPNEHAWVVKGWSANSGTLPLAWEVVEG